MISAEIGGVRRRFLYPRGMRVRYSVPEWQASYHRAAYAMLKSRDPLLTWTGFVAMALDQLCCEVFQEECVAPGEEPALQRQEEEPENN